MTKTKLSSTWDDGLLINGTVLVKEAVDVCALFETFSDAISRQGRKLASLQVATDNALLDPCKKDAAKGEPCGTTFCRADLGEQCIAGRVCACPKGQKRKNEEEACRVVSSYYPHLLFTYTFHSLIHSFLYSLATHLFMHVYIYIYMYK